MFPFLWDESRNARRMTNGRMLVLEVKGEDDQQNQTKRRFLDFEVDNPSELIRGFVHHGYRCRR